MRFKKLKVVRILGGALGLLLALSLVLVPAPALAVPPIPHQFYGTVTIDAELASEGTIVSARIGVTKYFSTTVDAQGRYGYILEVGGTGTFKVPADDPGTPDIKEGGVAGETVDFYIGLGEVKANETALFEIWGTTELNLTTIPQAPVTVHVTVQGQISTIWSGEVTFQTSTITDKEGDTHTIGYPTALGALDEAAEAGGFTYVVTSTLDFVEEIAGEANVGQSGWMYQVNGIMPMVAAVDYSLNDGDVVLWYYGTWSGILALTTDPATGIGTTTATLNGDLTDLGDASSVEVSFEWGTTTAYGSETTPQTMTDTGPFTASLTGLSPSTTYHFKAKAEIVGEETIYGEGKSFTTRAVSTGGGGGGVLRYYMDTSLFGVEEEFRTSLSGEVRETIEATSEDGMLTLTIPDGTIALNKDGKRLKGLEVAVDETPPDPPEDAYIIELAYDFGPDGATFDPGITFEYTYDPAELPGGVAEADLVIAFYDAEAGEWVTCDCTCDPEANCITACVCHFTTFAIIGAVTPPEEEEVVPPEEEEVVPPEEEEVVPPEEEEVVPPEEEEVVPPEEVVPAKPPVNWPVIGGIIGGVIVVGLLIFFLVWRRRAA